MSRQENAETSVTDYAARGAYLRGKARTKARDTVQPIVAAEENLESAEDAPGTAIERGSGNMDSRQKILAAGAARAAALAALSGLDDHARAAALAAANKAYDEALAAAKGGKIPPP